MKTASVPVWLAVLWVLSTFAECGIHRVERECDRRFPEHKTRHTLPEGCMVRVGGEWVPAGSVRIDVSPRVERD